MNRFIICGVSDNGKVRCYDREDGYCEEVYPEQLKALNIKCDMDYSYDYSYELWSSLESDGMLDRPMPVYRMDKLCSHLHRLYEEFGYGLPDTVKYQHRFTRPMYRKAGLGIFMFDIHNDYLVVNIVHMFKSRIIRSNFTINNSFTIDDIHNKRLSVSTYSMMDGDIIVGFDITYAIGYLKYQFDKNGKQVEVLW